MRAAVLSILCIVVATSGIAAGKGGPEVVEGTVPGPDGVEIAYDVRGAGEPTLVFIHCWSCDREFWRNQVGVFSIDHRVVTLDLPGHGESGKGRESWSIAGLAPDVKAVIEHLELDEVILIGHSMGGPVSVETARLLPDRIKGIICVDTLHDLERKLEPERMATFTKMFEDDFEGTMRGFFATMADAGADSSTVQWIADKAVESDKEVAVALMRDFVNLDLPSSVAELSIPIRCINAAPNPPMRPPTEIEKNRKYGDFDAAFIEGVGHFPHLERPEAFNEELRAALNALLSQ